MIVGTNGGIQLGEDGDDDDIDYDYWEDDYFDDFNDDGGFPVILPFGTDVDLSATGTIHFQRLRRPGSVHLERGGNE